MNSIRPENTPCAPGRASPPSATARSTHRPARADHASRQRGFTLIEIIAVLVIMAVITAVAAERFFDQSNGELGAAAAQLRNKIRYARTRSMNSDDIYGFQIISSSTYEIFRSRDGVRTNIALPGEESRMTLPEGVTVSGVGTLLTFDHWGRPCTDLTGDTRQGQHTVLTLSLNGLSETITIVRNTGYLQ